MNSCELKSDPASYNHKLVEVTSFVSHGFEDFTLFDPICSSWPDVWLEYGGTVKSGTMYCCGVTDSRSRPKELELENIRIPLVEDERFHEFDALIQRRPDSILHATIVGRFFAGQQSDDPKRPSLRGYGHLGCCSLLAIQQVVSVDPERRTDLDYRADPDQPQTGKRDCGYRNLTSISPYDASIQTQRVAENGQYSWAFDDPKRVARDSLAELLKIDATSIQEMKQIVAAPGRFVYKWKPAHRRASYLVVVNRPYWLSFYSKDPNSFAWVVIAAWELCG